MSFPSFQILPALLSICLILMVKVVQCGRCFFLSPHLQTSLNYHFWTLWNLSVDRQLFSFILVKRRLSSYFCQVKSPISFLKQKTVSGAPASICLDCVNVGKALEDAKAAQEETIKRFHFSFSICNFCFFNSDNFCLILVALLREERLGQVVGVAPGDLVAAVEQLVDKAAQLRTEVLIQPLWWSSYSSSSSSSLSQIEWTS